MKILILSQTFPLTPTDATAHFMYDFARGFKEIGHQVHVLLPFHKQLKPRQFKGLKIHTFRYIWPEILHLLGFGRSLLGDQRLPLTAYLLAPFYFFFGMLALLKISRKEKIDVVNAHWVLPNGFLAAVISRMTHIPLVITLPGSDVYLTQKNLLFNWLARFSLRQAKEVVSNSPQLLTDLKIKGKIISYGVPVAGGLTPPPRGSTSHTPGVSLVIATAGRRVEKKGFKFLQSFYPDIEIISGLPIGDFRKKLHSVDIFLAHSIRDSAGNLDDASLVVLEAMAAGCAVIASDLSGYRRMIRDGQNGLLVVANDKKAWVVAVERCKKSKTFRQKLGKAARETVKKLFTPEKIAKRYTKVFQN